MNYTYTGRAKSFALLGIFLSMSVSMLSLTVVGTSMPIIIADLGGTQGAYTWVITGTMLTSAITTPIWGKLADLTSKKVLLQATLVTFTLGSMLSGLAQDPFQLIGFRILQGAGTGGISTLGLIILAEIVSPRERSKYIGITGSIMALSQIGGPLLGGTITDLIGWRYNFYVAVPIALIAIITLQRTLHLSTQKQPIRLDIAGALLISTGVATVLVWVTIGGNTFAWVSLHSGLLLGTGVLLLAVAMIVELRVSDPFLPVSLFRNPTFRMSVFASSIVGVAMFSTSIFIGQYFQLSRAQSPTESGLLTIPMMVGIFLSSTLIGSLINRSGRWKAKLIGGAIAMTLGMFMLGQLNGSTPFLYISVALFTMGAGIGAVMQNLVLIVQNSVEPDKTGVASSGVAFFRIIGGAISMSAMGTVLEHLMISKLTARFAELSDDLRAGTESLLLGSIPHLSELDEPIRTIVQSAYGTSMGTIYLVLSPLMLITIICIAQIPNAPLGNQSNIEYRNSQISAPPE